MKFCGYSEPQKRDVVFTARGHTALWDQSQLTPDDVLFSYNSKRFSPWAQGGQVGPCH